MKPKIRIIFLFLVFSLVFFGFNSSYARGQESFYIGLNLAYSTLGGGDFDSLPFVSNEGVLISFPSLDAAGIAWGFVLGFRQDKWLSYEISFLSSSHDAMLYDPRENSDGDFSERITRNQYIFNIKIHPPITKRLDVYGILGASYNGLFVKDNFFLGETYLVGSYDLRWKYHREGDAIFHGSGLNLGIGLQYKVMEALYISVTGMFNSLGFKSARATFNSAGETIKQSYEFDKLKGSGYGVLVSFVYHLFF